MLNMLGKGDYLTGCQEYWLSVFSQENDHG